MRHGERAPVGNRLDHPGRDRLSHAPPDPGYALLLGLVYPITLVVTTLRPDAPRPVLGRVSV